MVQPTANVQNFTPESKNVVRQVFLPPTRVRPTATPVLTADEKLDRHEREIGKLHNVEREKHGLRPLQWVNALQVIARDHSRDMAENSYFEHTNLQGENASARGRKAGYPCSKASSIGLGENIHFGYVRDRPEVAVKSWMNSPGHRETSWIRVTTG